jgi:prevent-host-death family protein
MPTKTTAKISRRRFGRRKAVAAVRRRSSGRSAGGAAPKALVRAVSTGRSSADAAKIFASIPHVTSADGRQTFSDIVNRVGYGKEPIAVSRRGKPLAVLISVDDFVRFRQLEDVLDGLEADAAIEAFKESGAKAIPLDEALAQLKK